MSFGRQDCAGCKLTGAPSFSGATIVVGLPSSRDVTAVELLTNARVLVGQDRRRGGERFIEHCAVIGRKRPVGWRLDLHG